VPQIACWANIDFVPLLFFFVPRQYSREIPDMIQDFIQTMSVHDQPEGQIEMAIPGVVPSQLT